VGGAFRGSERYVWSLSAFYLFVGGFSDYMRYFWRSPPLQFVFSADENRLTYVMVGFDWHALPRGSVIVDVGGGIGSTTMLLANAFSHASHISSGDDDEGLGLGFEFVIQDRQVVVEMGEKVYRHFIGTRFRHILNDLFRRGEPRAQNCWILEP
jgi:hypothetical protein